MGNEDAHVTVEEWDQLLAKRLGNNTLLSNATTAKNNDITSGSSARSIASFSATPTFVGNTSQKVFKRALMRKKAADAIHPTDSDGSNGASKFVYEGHALCFSSSM